MTALPDPVDVSLYNFARAFRFGDNPILYFRVLPPKFQNLRKPTKEDLELFKSDQPYLDWRQSLLNPYGVKSAPYNKDLALDLLKRPKHETIRNLERINACADARCPYFVVNQGGQEKKDINQITAFFGEWDDIALEEQYAKVMALPIPPHIIVKTRSSLHCYWLAVEGTTIEQWEAVQRTFIVHTNSDPQISDLPRVMRVPGFDHTTFDFETGRLTRVPVTVLKFDTGERITAEQILSMMAEAGQAEVSKAEFDAWRRLRNANNKQRVKVRQERERKGAAHQLYDGEPPADLRQVYNDICAQLQIAGVASNGQRAICPCCEDPNPSFIIELTSDKILMTDHAGCTFPELCESVGVEQRHCFARKPDEQAEAGDDGPTLAQLLINLALANSKLFHDAGGDAYLSVMLGDHRETFRLGSRDSKDWLAGLLYRKTGRVASGDKINEALTVLRAIARHESPEMEAHVRIAECDGAIYLDLCDKDWRQIKITESGWRMIASADSPVRFVRAKGMLPLPEPARGGQITELRDLLNLREDDVDNWPMVLGWLVAALRPCNAEGFDYPVLAIHGEQGSAKSSAQRILRDLVDPNKATLRAAPRDERDLAIAASHGRVISCDNLTYISDPLSNAFCRLSTGGGFATRELFTDDGEVIFDAQRPVILNGIAEVVTRSDLLDRTLLTQLPMIEPARRWRKRILNRKFNAARPRILGALLDAVSAGLQRLKEEIELEEWPRLSDFAEWVIACEKALGLDDGAFIAAYKRNVKRANGLAIDASLVAQAIIDLIDRKPEKKFDGTVKGLLDELNKRIEEAGGQPKQKEGWPQNSEKLRAELVKLAPNLRREKIAVTFGRRTNKGRQLTVAREVTDRPSQPSHRHEANELNKLDGDGPSDGLLFDESGTVTQANEQNGGSPVGDGPYSDGNRDRHSDRHRVNHCKQSAGDGVTVVTVDPVLIPPTSGREVTEI